jgi:hypothetical protein
MEPAKAMRATREQYGIIISVQPPDGELRVTLGTPSGELLRESRAVGWSPKASMGIYAHSPPTPSASATFRVMKDRIPSGILYQGFVTLRCYALNKHYGIDA